MTLFGLDVCLMCSMVQEFWTVTLCLDISRFKDVYQQAWNVEPV